MEIAPDLATYQEEKDHSLLVDHWLGLEIEKTEKRLSQYKDHEIWTKVPFATMLTPYSEIRKIISALNPKQDDLIVDLGAGYGRMGFVIAKYFPGINFLGLELVSERVREGNRVLNLMGAKNAKLERFDLSQNKPPKAKFYFIYDFGTPRAIEKVLCDLREYSSEQRIVLAGRGGSVREAIERRHPWLGEVIPPEHFPYFSIYQSSFAANNL